MTCCEPMRAWVSRSSVTPGQYRSTMNVGTAASPRARPPKMPASTYGPGGTKESGGFLYLFKAAWSWHSGGRGRAALCGELAGQLGPGADPELAVDPGQVGVHGLHADEQGVGNLTVGVASRHQLGHPLLARGEPGWCRRPQPDPAQLGSGLVSPQRRAEALKDLHGSLQGVPGRALLPGPPPDGDRKSTRLNSSHVEISYAVFCLKKKKKNLKPLLKLKKKTKDQKHLHTRKTN